MKVVILLTKNALEPGQKPKWNTTATIRVLQALAEDVMYPRQPIRTIPRGLRTEDCLSCRLDTVTQSRVVGSARGQSQANVIA